MKKLIATLVIAIVLVGAVFATTNNKITLTTTVGRIKPNFTIVCAALGAEAGDTVDTTKDLSEEDITASFELLQSGNEQTKDYSRYKGAITLTVTIHPFTATIGTGNDAHEAAQGTAYAIQTTGTAKGTEVANKLTLGNPSIDQDAHSVTFGLTYAGKKVTDEEAAHLGTIAVKWTKDPDLEMAGESTTYSTDIVLTYTVN